MKTVIIISRFLISSDRNYKISDKNGNAAINFVATLRPVRIIQRIEHNVLTLMILINF